MHNYYLRRLKEFADSSANGWALEIATEFRDNRQIICELHLLEFLAQTYELKGDHKRARNVLTEMSNLAAQSEWKHLQRRAQMLIRFLSSRDTKDFSSKNLPGSWYLLGAESTDLLLETSEGGRFVGLPNHGRIPAPSSEILSELLRFLSAPENFQREITYEEMVRVLWSEGYDPTIHKARLYQVSVRWNRWIKKEFLFQDALISIYGKGYKSRIQFKV